MGKWNRRWLPRKSHFHQEAPESLPRPVNTEPLRGSWQNSVPPWEKKFCTLVGSIPWQKVVYAKKFMYCHGNVLNWNDTAGEEAFHNAKKRFWAEINGLSCDISLPDPDVYIDEIDWNPDIDPQLILDLDREYFASDDGGKDGKVGNTNPDTNNSVSGWASEGRDRNPNNGDNCWECSYMHGTEALKDKGEGWNQWDTCIKESRSLGNDDNPWERSYTQGNGAVKDNAWGDCGDKSWGWNQGGNCINRSRNLDNGNNPWEHSCQGVGSVKDRGQGDFGDNSWGWNHWENSINESSNLVNGGNSWECRFIQGSGAPEDRPWRACGNNSWGWKQWENYNNEPKNLESRRTNESWRAWNGGCRKREGSHQYISGYKSSRFEGDDYQAGHYWRKGGSKRRVSFVFE